VSLRSSSKSRQAPGISVHHLIKWRVIVSRAALAVEVTARGSMPAEVHRKRRPLKHGVVIRLAEHADRENEE